MKGAFLRRWARSLLGRARLGFMKARILKYRFLSFSGYSGARPQCEQPLLLHNSGHVFFGRNLVFGYRRSPGFWNSHAFVDCRSPQGQILFGDDIHINNGFSVICEKTMIRIGNNCLIGHDVTILDSDFHAIDPEARLRKESPRQLPVEIGANVFIGSKAIILKGTVIGANSVVGAGAVVSGSFPENSLIVGNPAVLVRRL